MSLTTVYTALNAADAQLIHSRLEAAGFHSVVMGELSAFSLEGYTLAAGGIRVQVPESEVEDARLLIESGEASESTDDVPPVIPPPA
jgi:hypothetical protein